MPFGQYFASVLNELDNKDVNRRIESRMVAGGVDDHRVMSIANQP